VANYARRIRREMSQPWGELPGYLAWHWVGRNAGVYWVCPYTRDVKLDTTRVPPTPAVLQELLGESLATLDAAVVNYHERDDVTLIAPAATALRMLCHETQAQVPLLAQLERYGIAVPPFVDASPGTFTGFAVVFQLKWAGQDRGVAPIGGRMTSNALARRADGVSACDHDGKATGRLRLNPVRAEVVCDHCAAILQVNPPSAAVRFCDAVEMDQLFRRPRTGRTAGARSGDECSYAGRYLPVPSRCLHPGQQQGRRWPSSSSSCVRRIAAIR
jgi:hypothetical protein